MGTVKHSFTVYGRFCSLNEFYRLYHQQQGTVKRESDEIVAWSAKAKLKPIKRPVIVHCHWVEKNRKRDLDNVFFAVKFILDGLVKAGILANDTHHEIAGISHTIAYDSQNPRIEITLEEII